MRGLPRDAVPAIDDPVFMKGAGARFRRPDEDVIGITDGKTAKAYSAWHLNGHEIVNDRLGDRPIAVTWCPQGVPSSRPPQVSTRDAHHASDRPATTRKRTHTYQRTRRRVVVS